MKHPESRKPLARFLVVAREANRPHFPAVRQTFPATDYTARSGKLIVDIGGNKYRLIASVNFTDQILVVEQILMHKEYDRKAF